MKKIEKDEDLKFIKRFAKIKVSRICKELKIDYANVYHGTASEKKIKQVAESLKDEIDKIYWEDIL